MITFSDQQKHLARFGERDGVHIVVVGPKGSGKTWSVFPGFLYWASTQFAGATFYILAASMGNIRTLIEPVFEWFGDTAGLPYRINYGNNNIWTMDSVGGLPNKFRVVPFGDGKESKAKSIKGPNASGAYIDEATDVSEEVRNELIMRCREGEFKLWWTTNPAGLQHEFKIEMVDKIDAEERDGETHTLLHSANPSWNERKMKELIAANPEKHMYERNVLGIWSTPEGAVYPGIGFRWDEEHPNGRIRPIEQTPVIKYVVGIDPGPGTVTHAMLFAVTVEGLWAVREWRYAHKGLTGAELAKCIFDYFQIGMKLSVDAWIVDKAGGDLAGPLGALVGYKRIKASAGNPVRDGVTLVCQVLNAQRYWIDPAVRHHIREMSNYSWPEDGDEKQGTMNPVKDGNEHSCDVARYVIEHTFGDIMGTKRRKSSRLVRAA